jgi:homoserine kinase type II
MDAEMIERQGPVAAGLRQVLAHYLVRPDAIKRIRGGRANRHWRVITRRRLYVLRRYHPRRMPAQIDFEHRLLTYLGSRLVPIAAPIPDASGETLVLLGGRKYALFPFVPGRPAPYSHPRYLRLKGRALAQMHRHARFAPVREQREGFGRVWEPNGAAGFVDADAFESALDRCAWEYPSLAGSLRRAREANREELTRLGYHELPDLPCHMDFHHDNIRFEKGGLTGVIDFDWARRDARVADIAFSIASDCLEAPLHTAINPGAAAAFLQGYVEVDRLSADELQLVVPLLRAHALTMAAYRLSEWTEGSAKALSSIEHWLRERMPAIGEREHTLEAALAELTR